MSINKLVFSSQKVWQCYLLPRCRLCVSRINMRRISPLTRSPKTKSKVTPNGKICQLPKLNAGWIHRSIMIAKNKVFLFKDWRYDQQKICASLRTSLKSVPTYQTDRCFLELTGALGIHLCSLEASFFLFFVRNDCKRSLWRNDSYLSIMESSLIAEFFRKKGFFPPPTRVFS